MEQNLESLFGLRGLTAVAIGGSGVLGGALVDALAMAGARVAIAYHTGRDRAEAKVREVEGRGGEAMTVQADASSKSDLERACADIVGRWGGIDIVLNAPGVNSATPFLDITEEEWLRIMETNLKSMFLSCQVFGRQMIAQGRGGSIINISSASSGPPLSRVPTYSASKAGVNSLTQWLGREWAPHNIRVNAVVPGFFPAEQNRKILTEERRRSIFAHTPMNRYGEPQELAGAVIWLASPRASSFVTGSLVVVDGGFTAMTI
jgi:NAD(P)-dependent dehydrogenase (short-subunit alcohol dehydrogenase family)